MFYKFARFLAWIFIKIFFRVRVEGAENIPPDGGVLVCSNHIKWLDALTLGVCIKRSIHFMGKKEAFANAFFTFILTKLNAFPVDRSTTDMRAIKTAINLLASGEVLGIFVQGHRFTETDITTAKAGAAFFALKTDAQVIPARIAPHYRLFRRVSVTFGKPVCFDELREARPDSKTVDALTEKIVTAINTLI